MIEQAKVFATIPFHVIVRPRGGNFLYNDIEFAAMLGDVGALRRLVVAGAGASGDDQGRRRDRRDRQGRLAGLGEDAAAASSTASSSCFMRTPTGSPS
jgi:hypothetical protein